MTDVSGGTKRRSTPTASEPEGSQHQRFEPSITTRSRQVSGLCSCKLDGTAVQAAKACTEFDPSASARRNAAQTVRIWLEAIREHAPWPLLISAVNAGAPF